MAHPELLFAVEDRRGGSRREERGEEEEEGFQEEEDDVDAATNDALWRGGGGAGEAARAASPTGLAAAARGIQAERLVAMARTQEEVATHRGQRVGEGTREDQGVRRETR